MLLIRTTLIFIGSLGLTASMLSWANSIDSDNQSTQASPIPTISKSYMENELKRYEEDKRKAASSSISSGRTILALQAEEDVQLLAATLYYEARGEGKEGMREVAKVILNRVKAPRWGNRIRDVVLQPAQFSYLDEMHKFKPENFEPEMYQKALEIAEHAIANKEVFRLDADHYHSNKIQPPKWSKSFIKVRSVGNHIFYSSR